MPAQGAALELAVIIPTLNERGNIDPLLERLDRALQGIRWEAIFVDDNSTDGTTALLRERALSDPRVRFLHRIHRRGLASACLEGMLATPAPYLAVIDADLQHDESLLPKMLETIRAERLDLVIGSRNLQPGGMGEFAAARIQLSRLGALASKKLLPSLAELSDPMSGFFLLDRRFLDRVIHRASGRGFKILVDLIASSPTKVRFRELPYRFGLREHGESKLDLSVGFELFYLVADKLVGQYVPVRFLLFVLAGLPGLVVHLFCLGLLLRFGVAFSPANAASTLVAMTLNFFINNWFTYRDQRLRGMRLLEGLLWFYLACTVGAVASFSIANFLNDRHTPWYFAGLAGMGIASVWNYATTRALAWRSRQRG